MKYKISISAIVFILSTVSIRSANRSDLSISSIPDSLIKSAYGVIRHESTEFEYKSPVNGTEKRIFAITILDKKGKEMADFSYTADRFHALKSFSAQLYNSNGVLIKKFGYSALQNTNWSSDLANDDKKYFFDCQSPVYPFTIEYEYEVGYKNGILSFPFFCPQSEYNMSVMKADFRLILPDTLLYRQKAVNMTEKPLITKIKNTATYTWKIENRSAIETEKFSPGLLAIVPYLLSNPRHFVFDDYTGDNTDWQSLSKWLSSLLKNRDILTDATKNKIRELTQNAKSDREKVKILYDYLGKTTRYVSIQLGIGGLQPIPAAEVCKTGFGDCKGLSNYLKAMLEVAGIKSNLIYIRYDKQRETIFRDYSSTNQMNHAILQVPLANDTLWLECTNPNVPFGFIHNGIAGHDALVINNNSGSICHLPNYPDSLNIEKNRATITLNQDGSAKVSSQKIYRVKMYDNNDNMIGMKSTEQADVLREDIDLPNVTIGSIQTKENKSALPELSVDFSWITPMYGNKTGTRIFIPVNPYRSMNQWVRESNRRHNIKVSIGYKYIDSLSIKIPVGYDIEAMPASEKLQSKFGQFDSRIKIKDSEILISQQLFLPSGVYNESDYAEFMALLDKASINYRSRIILRKKEQ